MSKTKTRKLTGLINSKDKSIEKSSIVRLMKTVIKSHVNGTVQIHT